MWLLSYSNVTNIYPVSCLVEIKLFQIVSKNSFKLFQKVVPNCITKLLRIISYWKNWLVIADSLLPRLRSLRMSDSVRDSNQITDWFAFVDSPTLQEEVQVEWTLESGLNSAAAALVRVGVCLCRRLVCDTGKLTSANNSDLTWIKLMGLRDELMIYVD